MIAARRRPSPHAQLTERDLAVLRDIVGFGALSIEQVARRHFGSAPQAYARLGSLIALGFLRAERVWYRGPGVYLATVVGAKLADVGLPAGPTHLK